MILKVLVYGANLNPGTDPAPAPLGEGVASTRISLFEFVLVACVISSSHHARDHAQGLGGARNALKGVFTGGMPITTSELSL
jgi:hypothetical protein